MAKMTVIVTNGYADWECALLAAVARGYYGVTVTTASPDGAPVTSQGGFAVTPDSAIADIAPDDTDILVVVGGTAWDGPAAPDIAPLLKAMIAHGKPVAAICGGVHTLARAGLLDEVAHTGNSAEDLAALPGYRGGAHYVDQSQALRAGAIITASGTAPVSFMKAICEILGVGGSQLAFYVGLLGAEHAAA